MAEGNKENREMQKISSTQVKTLLKTASATIRNLNAENCALREKNAAYEKRARVEKIAAEMEEKGLHSDLSRQEKIAFLLDAKRAPNLDVTEEAVKMASPQKGVIGSLGDDVGANSASAFEQYILTGESPD
jgi:hypothetical protein